MRLERQEKNKEEWDRFLFFPGGTVQWRDTHAFLKRHGWLSCLAPERGWNAATAQWCPIEILPHSLETPLSGFWPEDLQYLQASAMLQGRPASVFHLVLFAGFVLFWKCGSKTKAKQFGSFWWSRDRRGFGFLMGLVTSLGSFCYLGKLQLTPTKTAPVWRYRYVS